MNKAELIKGIELTIAGLTAIKESLVAENDGVVAPITKESAKAVEKVVEKAGALTKAKEPVKEVKVEKSEKEPVGTVEGTFDREQLDSMKYNDLKKFGASLGVKCTGTRDEITERILATKVTAEVDAEEAKDIEEAGGKVVPMKKSVGKKVKKEEPKEEPQAVEDEFDEQAKAIAEETDKDEIIEALAEVGVKATPKNYVAKLADALRKGLIDLDEEEDVEETETEDDETVADGDEEDSEITPNSYFPEYDPNGYNDPDSMTEERAVAVQALVSGILEAIENEELGEEEIVTFIEDNATEDEMELLPEDYTEEQLVGFYLELRKRFVDDQGEEHEPSDPYELAGKDLCCGHELKYSKKNKRYICETCGEEYEAE